MRPEKPKKQKSLKRKLISRLIFIAAAVAVLVTFSLLMLSEAVSEFLTRTLSRALVTAIGFLTSVFPFSVFELLFVLLILAIFAGIVWLIVSLVRRGRRRKNPDNKSTARATEKPLVRAGLRLIDVVIAVLCFVIAYQACVGFAYHRAPLEIPAQVVDITDEFAFKATEYLIDDFITLANSLPRESDGRVKSPYTQAQLNAKIREEYKRLDTEGRYLNPYTVRYKKVLLSPVMAELNIAGFYFGPLGEANVSRIALPFETPFSAAHELAHSKGVMREDEAELTAMYLLLTSDDEFLRYSAYMNKVGAILNPVRNIDKEFHKELWGRIPQAVWKEFDLVEENYAKYKHFQDFGRMLNDFYLKLNGQDDGTASYNDYGTLTPSTPANPSEPVKYVYSYSVTEKVLLSIYGG